MTASAPLEPALTRRASGGIRPGQGRSPRGGGGPLSMSVDSIAAIRPKVSVMSGGGKSDIVLTLSFIYYLDGQQ